MACPRAGTPAIGSRAVLRALGGSAGPIEEVELNVRVRFRTEAASDVASARDWYDEQRVGLGDDFFRSLELVVKLVSELPEAFPEIAAGHRRALLGQFPYALYYRLDGPCWM